MVLMKRLLLIFGSRFLLTFPDIAENDFPFVQATLYTLAAAVRVCTSDVIFNYDINRLTQLFNCPYRTKFLVSILQNPRLLE